MNRYIVADLTEYDKGFYSHVFDCKQCQNLYDRHIIPNSNKEWIFNWAKSFFSVWNGTINGYPVTFKLLDVYYRWYQGLDRSCLGCQKNMCAHKLEELWQDNQVGFLFNCDDTSDDSIYVDTSDVFLCKKCFYDNDYFPNNHSDLWIGLDFVSKMVDKMKKQHTKDLLEMENKYLKMMLSSKLASRGRGRLA